ncbi:hypothetical protein M5E86_18575 [Blautia wexlerae]|nr:hypothetical protein M5E86_18575 [Blautia wexlerae]
MRERSERKCLRRKSILLKVSPEFHKDLKIYVTLRDVTLQDYIVDLIKKRHEQKSVREREETRTMKRDRI